MLFEGYIAKWKNYPVNERKIRVARPSRLGPSRSLLFRYKNDSMTWEEYEKEFRDEMYGDLEAIKVLRHIGELSEKQDVRLICYEKNPPCHRFILMDIIKELQGSVPCPTINNSENLSEKNSETKNGGKK